jgi:hypothetical protein
MGKKTGNSQISFQQRVFDSIKEQIGNNNMLTIPSKIMCFAGDFPSAAFLSQLIYWCDKGNSPDGYIFKTHKEWKQETLLSDYYITKSAEKFQKMGILDMKKKKANGSPTIYYKLDHKFFLDMFNEFLKNESENIKNENIKTCDSLTEHTSEPSPKPTKRNMVLQTESVQNALSFEEYCMKYNFDDSEKMEAIKYFLTAYRTHRGSEHPRLKADQWHRVIDTIFTCDDPFNDDGVIFQEDIKRMTETYFNTKFRDDCNYSILHFNSSGIKRHRFYEAGCR